MLAGLFFVMGIQALEANGITAKLVFLCIDHTLVSPSEPLSQIERKWVVWAFVALELIGFGATFAITQTIAAIGFPVFILLYIPMRTFLMPRFFTPSELNILDAPTASPFTMESVGGNHGQAAEASSNELLEEAERGESEGVLRQRRGSAVGSSSRRGMSFRSREEGGGGALGKE